MARDDDRATRQSGMVKWFDPVKGFGFILNDQGGPDILLHANVLRNYGRSSVADESVVEMLVQPTPRGLQAVEIMSILPPETGGSAPIADLDSALFDRIEELPLHPARVKWFDKPKGFGFANIFGNPEDVFLHIEVLRHSGFSDLTTGEAVGLRVAQGPRGLMAAQVIAWDNPGAKKAAGSLMTCSELHGIDQYLAHVAE